MAKKQYGAADQYERKLTKVMERLGIEEGEFNFNWDRFSCYVEFRYHGQLYRFDHSIEKARARGVELRYGSDAFAQVVLALEDLARMVERGIYDLSTWVAGMRYLPPPIEVPSFFKFLGFEQIPAGPEDVITRYKNLAKEYHPDSGGNEEDFKRLVKAVERGKAYFEAVRKKGGEMVNGNDK